MAFVSFLPDPLRRWIGLALFMIGPLAIVFPARSSPALGWTQLSLRDLDGAPLTLTARWYVTVFLSQDCPLSNASIPVLNRLAREFSPKGVAFIAAYVDPDADLLALKAHAAAYSLALPAADDRAQRLAHACGITYTPEVVIYSAAGLKLYQGRIDDRVSPSGAARPKATQEDVRLILSALTAEKAVPFSRAEGFGCALPEIERKHSGNR